MWPPRVWSGWAVPATRPRTKSPGSSRACDQRSCSGQNAGEVLRSRDVKLYFGELGMRVLRVEVLLPDRIIEAVERHGPRFGIAIEIAGDALGR